MSVLEMWARLSNERAREGCTGSVSVLLPKREFLRLANEVWSMSRFAGGDNDKAIDLNKPIETAFPSGCNFTFRCDEILPTAPPPAAAS